MSADTTFIYPGRFDPFTLGHEDIAKRAATLCGRLVVAVAVKAHDRSFIIDAELRLQLCREILAPYDNIIVAALDGLLVDLARHHQAAAIVRGIRDIDDCPRELRAAQVNHRLSGGLETIWIPALANHAHISSTAARELAVYTSSGLEHFVRPAVARHLRDKP
ncbi:MAG: pantetheine-phosphate adenylyltransferase [Gammaproteobacteria bacterium]|nr:pantetheine-phosphate adenylyltransferase [Gammaproteobacteria bacterium]